MLQTFEKLVKKKNILLVGAGVNHQGKIKSAKKMSEPDRKASLSSNGLKKTIEWFKKNKDLSKNQHDSYNV